MEQGQSENITAIYVNKMTNRNIIVYIAEIIVLWWTFYPLYGVMT